MPAILWWLTVGTINYYLAFMPARSEWWFLSLIAGAISVYYLMQAIGDYVDERHNHYA